MSDATAPGSLNGADPEPRRRATPGALVHPAATALIAIVPRKSDWDLARTRHWYRVPVETAPREVLANQIATLAFYLPKQFGADAWQVRYCAPVVETSIHLRRELIPEEPHHPRAEKLYARLTLGPVAELPRPIPSRRQRRIVFIATMQEKLERAQEINDLFHDSPLEDEVWEALKAEKLDAERQVFVEGDRRRRYALDFAIYGQTRNVNVECDGDAYHANPDRAKYDNRRNNFLTSKHWSVLRYSTDEILSEMPRLMTEIHATLESCGGLVLEAPNVEPPNMLWQNSLWDTSIARGHSIDPTRPAPKRRRR